MFSSLWPILLALLPVVAADDPEYLQDPYLAYRPPFARSLPVQIMLTGVVLTLVAVLFIHLMFTAQYHWPLAPVNYVLQLSGVTTLLISLIATIHVVLSATFTESEKWPYMLSYIAVNVPPLDLDSDDQGWSLAERATWLVMNASTSGLIQITHIQFLTLLYPSRLEGRLIFTLLGPLAVVAAVMQLLPISGSTAVYTVASAVRNVCNATLSLLFTLALFIWGLLVNRKSAWRTDGGTAVFGCAALSLAVVSTALNFLYVHKEEEFVWLPGLMWAVVLWQSFLGWWWWVGAGSAGAFASEDEKMEERLRRQAKRDARRKEKRERKKEAKALSANKVWKGVTGAFSSNNNPIAAHNAHQDEGRTTSLEHSLGLSHRRWTTPPEEGTTNNNDTNTNNRIPHHKRTLVPSTNLLSAASPTPMLTPTPTTVTSTSTSASTFGTVTDTTHTQPRLIPGTVYRWYTSLRRAHNAAARVQAAERVEKMREMGAVTTVMSEDAESGSGIGNGGADVGGDDVGDHAYHEHGESGCADVEDEKEDIKEVKRCDEHGKAGHKGREMGRRRRRRRETVEVDGWGFGWEGLGWRRRRTVYEERPGAVASASVSAAGRDVVYDTESRERRQTRRRTNRQEQEQEYASPSGSDKDLTDEYEDEEDEEDMYVLDNQDQPTANVPARRQPTTSTAPPPPPALVPIKAVLPGPGAPVPEAKPRSVWWWGPLWRWRLQDSTVYR